MINMARAGLGQSYYGETADDLDPSRRIFVIDQYSGLEFKIRAQSPDYVG